MISHKGEQVFGENTDETLAGKIIEHTENNSNSPHYTNHNSGNDEKTHAGTIKKYTTIIVFSASLFLLFLLFRKYVKDLQ